MSGYSYSEIQNMQQKAMERVREMKRNSDIITKTAQRDFDFTPKSNKEDDYHKEAKTKVTNMPPNFPENKAYTYFKDYHKPDENIKKTMSFGRNIWKRQKILLD